MDRLFKISAVLLAAGGALLLAVLNLPGDHITLAVVAGSLYGSGLGHWPYLIGLNDYGLTPENLTAEWIDDRAASWVADRSNENPEATP